MLLLFEMTCYTVLDDFTNNSSTYFFVVHQLSQLEKPVGTSKKLIATQVSISIGSISEIAMLAMCLSIPRGGHSNGTLLAILRASNARVVEARQAFLRWRQLCQLIPNPDENHWKARCVLFFNIYRFQPIKLQINHSGFRLNWSSVWCFHIDCKPWLGLILGRYHLGGAIQASQSEILVDPWVVVPHKA